VLAADLLAGDTDPRAGVVARCHRALAGLEQAAPGHGQVRVRGDIGYFTKDIADAVIAAGCDFAIGANRNPATWRAAAVESWYRHRTDIEGRIRDANHGAALRHLPSGDPAVNTAWMWGALLAVNLSAWRHELGGLDHGAGRGRAHLNRLRREPICIPGRVVRHARRITLRLPAGVTRLAEVLARLLALPRFA
jgi:hypothetical protein